VTNPAAAASMDSVTPDAAAANAADAAAAAADVAARSAGVRIRPLTELDEFAAVCRLYDAIWRPDPANPPVTAELLRALSKAGNYVAGAYDGTGLVGAAAGFFGAPLHRELHSHITGVSAAALGRSVGFALKLHQRAWALQRSVTTITWTFDPLVRRNAHFNLAKLAAVPAEYLPNFYGGMHDSINAGDDTDRLLIRWELTAPHVARASAGVPRSCDADAYRAAGAVVALDRSPSGDPVRGPSGGDTVLVAVPADVEALRVTAPGSARAWRAAVRETLGPLLAEGARVDGFDRAGWYVVTRAPEGTVR
jgi:predicted GNAT superfamily acetyltransferase